MIRYLAAHFAIASLFLSSVNAAEPSQLEANKNVARRALAAIEKGDLKELNALYEPEGLVHLSNGTQTTEHGPHADLKSASPLFAAFNPRTVTIEVMVAEDDLVTVRWTLRGRHSGEYRGVPPTGKEISMIYTNIFRIRNGRIAENWVSNNRLTVLEQLGIVCEQPGGK